MSRLTRKLYEGIKSPRHGLELLIRNTCPQIVPDERWIQFVAEIRFGRKLAQQLCKGVPFVRVDFFDVNGHVYFGEFTFYDWGGMQPFADAQWDECIGSWIQLPNEQGANRNNAGCKQ